MKANCPTPRADLKIHVVEGETLVFDRKRESIHQFNQTASYIWSLCNGQSTEADIASQFTETFEVDPATAAKDVSAVVREFESLHLLEN